VYVPGVLSMKMEGSLPPLGCALWWHAYRKPEVELVGGLVSVVAADTDSLDVRRGRWSYLV